MLLFTCSVSRAGHLELPENENEFINGLKRLLEGEGQNSFNAKMGKHFGMQQNGLTRLQKLINLPPPPSSKKSPKKPTQIRAPCYLHEYP